MTKLTKAFLLALFVVLAIMAPSLIACDNNDSNAQGTSTPTPACVLVIDANGTHEEGNCPQP